MSAEAQKVLRVFPTKSSEKEGPKPMPSFPDMVAYVQEKVRLSAFFIVLETIHPGYMVAVFAKRNINLVSFFGYVIVRLLRGSRLQLSTLLEPPLFLSTHPRLGR